MMTEGELQDKIRLALGRIPGLVLWRNNIGRTQSAKGWIWYGVGNPGGADLIGCYLGRFVAIEVKTATGRQSPEQRDWQGVVERAGGVYLLVRSVEEAVKLVGNLRPLTQAG